MDWSTIAPPVVAALIVGFIGGLAAAYVAMRIHIAVDEVRQTELLKWIASVDSWRERHAARMEAMSGHEKRLDKLERRVFNGSQRQD